MLKSWELVVYSLLSILGLNTILLMVTPRGFLPVISSQEKWDTDASLIDENQTCCSCIVLTATDGTRNKSNIWNQLVNYSHIVKNYPSLDPGYRTTTMTRLGTDLHVDLSTCPEGSLMAVINKTFSPLHLDCPTLFIVGARKAGTSSLYHYVSKHPDFEGTRLDRGPKVGETFYFSSKFESTTWSTFLQNFPSDGVMTGESSVGNLVSCEAPVRLFKSCGKQAKVVMLFRNPINRYVSNFLMRVRLGSTRMSNTTSISTVLKLHLDKFFNKILHRQVDVTKLPSQWAAMVCAFDPAINMIYEGLYYVHLMNWLCNFPAENILVVNSEEFYRKPSTILDQVFQFLGLKKLDNETYNWITSNVYNQGAHKIPEFQTLSLLDKKKLTGVYRPMNEALFSLLDWQNEIWD